MINEYQYIVDWEPADRVFVARVTEFPSLAAHGDSQEEALREIRGVVEEVIADLNATGEPVPEPLCLRQYSGKLNLRMPPDLHRRLAVEADRKGVSLNQFINMKLVQ
ncbi:toxin-antitoxin system HicB family antitoxin [Stigmatella sp. ncwal1]|uniref:Toxin-antitoxin system HicB family antitoxin n=1 Tax=Stigmatella ashevillensis TaxID=2995309 RepID=A0ABT5DE11_9BACT|nr:toxin-antitoxin system HicB family antitoxin [Stigmatella ashevillena]MDC0711892.1 toxin-antitoxin system HicB family antitoxin [Stigmatella ashevillena]